MQKAEFSVVLSKKRDLCFDYIIIGAGLSGLLYAASLKKKGFDVLILDAADFAGGTSRTVFTPIGLADNGLKFLSYNENINYAEITEMLSFVIDQPVSFEVVDNGPITFTHKEMKPFVGFGSAAPDFHKPLSYYLTPKRVQFMINGKILSIGELTSKLVSLVSGSFVERSLVTQLIKSEDGRITHVMVNGTKQIAGLNFIYCGSPKLFTSLMPITAIPLKVRQRISKGIYWTTICLDFFHTTQISERTELHLLNGTTQDEIGPCVGVFHEPVASKDNPAQLIQHSQWLTFLDDESTSDAEAMGAILKKIKRQIKRAYPEAFEHLQSERIAVLPLREAELDIKISGIDNLILGTGAWCGHSDIVGNLQHIQKIIFGIEPLIEAASIPEAQKPEVPKPEINLAEAT